MSAMLYTVAHGVIPPLARAVWRPTVEGLHHLPSTGPVIVASNHLSFFDSVVIPVVVPRKVVFLAKSDYFTGTGVKGALTRTWFEGLGMLPVKHGSPTVPMPRTRADPFASVPVEETRSDGASWLSWRMSVAPLFCISSAPTAVTAIGTSWRTWRRPCAVTMISPESSSAAS